MKTPEEMLELLKTVSSGPWIAEKYNYEDRMYMEFTERAEVYREDEDAKYAITRQDWSSPVFADTQFIAESREFVPWAAKRLIEAEALLKLASGNLTKTTDLLYQKGYPEFVNYNTRLAAEIDRFLEVTDP